MHSLGGPHYNGNSEKRIQWFTNNTATTGGIAIASNLKGCDGQRILFEGTPFVVMNGAFMSQGNKFDISDVETIAVRLNLYEVERYRSSRGNQGMSTVKNPYKVVTIPGFRLVDSDVDCMFTKPTPQIVHTGPEERACSTAYWMWDFLRRSGALGFCMGISGGVDSAASLALVAVMCQMVMESYREASGYNQDVIRSDLERICGKIPADAREMIGLIAHTAHLSTQSSSSATQTIACNIAEEIGSSHTIGNIDDVW